MKQLAYISSAAYLMGDEELMDILKAARKRNSELNVTGVLLYSEGTFIQVLEGDVKVIEGIYKHIELDSRHKNMIKLVDKPLSKRYFPDWSMGFATINMDQAREITGFINSTENLTNGDSKHTLSNLLKTFIQVNNLKIEF